MELEKYMLEIDYYYHYIGYDEDDDVMEKEVVYYPVKDLVNKESQVGRLYFNISSVTADDGSLAGIEIGIMGEKKILTLNESVKFEDSYKLYDDRESYKRRIFKLIEK